MVFGYFCVGGGGGSEEVGGLGCGGGLDCTVVSCFLLLVVVLFLKVCQIVEEALVAEGGVLVDVDEVELLESPRNINLLEHFIILQLFLSESILRLFEQIR